MSEPRAQTEDDPTLKRYEVFTKDELGYRGQALSEENLDGEWVRHEDVVHLLRFWGGYIQGHREMLESMKLHPKIIAAVRKAEKAFNEFGNE